MSGEEGSTQAPPPPPVVVEYDSITGVPAEYNEFLPHDTPEYKRWKAAQDGGAEALEKLTLKDGEGNEIEKQLPGGKVKKKEKAEVVIEKSVRNGKKSITSVTGLDKFGIKLSDASKVFGKKFATGASVQKTPAGAEQIEMQGNFLASLPEVILKNFTSNGVTKEALYYIEGKKKQHYYDESGDLLYDADD